MGARHGTRTSARALVRWERRLGPVKLRSVLALVLLLAACGPSPEAVIPQPLVLPEPRVVAKPLPVVDAGAASLPQDAMAPYYAHVALLRDPPPKDPREVLRLKRALDELRVLADPRAGDSLVDYLATNPPARFRSAAAIALGAVGDVRAAPTLAWRLKQDPLKLYAKDEDAALRQDDNERVVSARLLGDLLAENPDDATLAKSAAEGALAWIADKPMLHANAMRVLALSRVPGSLATLRNWADPSEPLPAPGAPPPLSNAYMDAQSGLRWYGAALRLANQKDEASLKLFKKQLTRRPPKVDVTMDALMLGGTAMLGMTLRALGVGAAHGLAELGDPSAFAPLVQFVEDQKNNEQARIEACFALGWTGTDDQLRGLVPKVSDPVPRDAKRELVRSCYLQALAIRPLTGHAAGLLPLLSPKTNMETRHEAARAIGFHGVDAAVVPKLVSLLADTSVRPDAALALLLGADEATAAAAVAQVEAGDPAGVDELKVLYVQSLGYFSDAALEQGVFARWVKNARANKTPWARELVERALAGVDYDHGPHTLTRTRLRVRLYAHARGTDAKKRDDALLVLDAMGERGILGALGR